MPIGRSAADRDDNSDEEEQNENRSSRSCCENENARHTPSVNMTVEACSKLYESYDIPSSELYCNWTFDKILCWSPTKAGATTSQRCPPMQGSDPLKFVHKRCSLDGRWEGLTPNDTSRPSGYTNYNTCFGPEIQELLNKLDTGGTEARMIKMDIARRTRVLEMVGLSVSLAALLVSLAIFSHFRGLRNNRTRIHKNLFIAMVVQVVIRLTLYIDQMISMNGATEDTGNRISIESTPYLCEACYVLLEYARTAMFSWMFVEGLYLHNVVTFTVFQEHAHYAAYTYLGWAAPAAMTATWAIVMACTKGTGSCWYGYNLIPYFWILEGPRLTVILLNFLFLLNIIRVLVVKLRQSHTSEIEQVRKAVRAALVLLPLLGIANVLKMPGVQTLDKAVWEFALWSYTTHFFTSFQGFFIASLYCFLNGEVRAAVMKSVSVYLSLRNHRFLQSTFIGRRNSAFISGNYDTTAAPNACTIAEVRPTTELQFQENSIAIIRNTNERISSASAESTNWRHFCCRGPQPVLPEVFAPETQV